MTYKRIAGIGAAAIGLAALISAAAAQQASVFGDKLGPVPVANSNRAQVSGTGWVTANLAGSTLTISGDYEGLSTPATGAQIHLAPPAQVGPAIIPLEVSGNTTGQVTGTINLTAEQLEQLNASSFYVVVQSQQNPAGELRGWLIAGNTPG